MYEINVSNRRVTQYIIEESYKWLYEKITAGEYQANNCKPGKRLLIDIQEQQCVSAENYKQFIELMDDSPYSYMMYRSRRKSSKRITTDELFNYFVKFNGHVLPLGFIKDFFEDDYETQREIDQLLEKYVVSENNTINVQWRKTLITREESVDRLKSVFPNMFRLHPALVITQILRMFLVAVRIFVIISFLNVMDFWGVMNRFFTVSKFDLKVPIEASGLMNAFCYDGIPFCRAGQSFTLGQYFGVYVAYFVVCLLAVLLLIPKIKTVISFLIFTLRVIWNNIRVAIPKLFIHLFEKKGLDTISNYFKKTTPDMVAARVIGDEHCKGLPSFLQFIYNYVDRLDIPKVCDKLGVQNAKYFSKGFAYDEKTLPAAKAMWRKGLVGYVIITLALAVMLYQPLGNLIIPSAITFFNSMFS